MREVLVGCSGWMYDDWVGPFYPKTIPKGKWLPYYAERFPTLEINATHYHMPTAERVRGTADRVSQTPLRHVVYKAPRMITHEALPEGALEETAELTDRFCQALAPMAQADLLAGLLFQFDHLTGPETLMPGLQAVLEHDPPAPLFVEVRHAAFNEDRHHEPLRALVAPTGGALVATDSPASTITRAPPDEAAYFRFHGRNEDTWFMENPPGIHGSARYDYLYPDAELEALADRVEAAKGDRVLVFFNNHAEGKAPANAQRLMEMLNLEPPRKRATLDDFR